MALTIVLAPSQVISVIKALKFLITYFYLVTACVSNEILEKGSLGILDGDVPPGSLNPDPISHQNMPFFIRLYALVVPLKTIPVSRP